MKEMPISINNFDDCIVATAPKSAVHEPPLPPKTVYFNTGTGTSSSSGDFPYFPPFLFLLDARFFERGGHRTSIIYRR
jgi:hypothetical protein